MHAIILYNLSQKLMTSFLFLGVKQFCAFWVNLVMSHNTNNSSLPSAANIRFHWSVLTQARNSENGLVSVKLTKKANHVRFADAHVSLSRTSVKRPQLSISSRNTWEPPAKLFVWNNMHFLWIKNMIEPFRWNEIN